VTKQEYYDLLVASAYDGTFPSTAGSHINQCVYRGEGRKRCAVGLLIPDDRYDKAYEGLLATTVFDGGLADLIPEGLSIEDLREVQKAHDATATNHLGGVKVWDAARFVRKLNTLPCFHGVVQAEGGTACASS
jgi:hypothetical protein